MTPLGLNSAAVPEAAALFPLSAAAPAAEDAAAASPAFGDLLTASFAQAEPPSQSAPANTAGAAFSTLSPADIWFAGLNVDLHSINTSLDAEETGVPVDAIASAEVPVDGAPRPDAVDDDAAGDEAAALMAAAMSMPVPNAWPEGHAPQVLDDAASSSAHPSGCAEDVPGVVARPARESVTAAVPTTVAMSAPSIEKHIDDQGPAVGDIVTPRAIREAPRELSALAPQGDHSRAASVISTAPMATAAATSVAEVAKNHVPVTDQLGNISSGAPGQPEGLVPQASMAGAAAPDVKQALPVSPGAPTGPAQQAGTVAVAPAPQQASPVEEQPIEQSNEQPRARLGHAIDVAPAVQQTGRTRETVAAKLTEMTGLGQSAEAAPKPAPGTNLESDSQSQSQTQDGRGQDAFVTGISASAAAARSAGSAAVMPVFTVAPPTDGGARAVPVEGAALPPAPPAATVPDPENVGRLVESMRVQMRNGIQEATIRLKPEHMGEVTISIRVERGAVSAVVHTETPAVQQWLESQEDKLRSGLSEQGLHLERFMVHRDRSQQQREQPRQQPPAPRYRPQRDDSAVRFEVLV